MENMIRRAISAFMALVLVLGMLPGVPMFAGAEEVETLAETTAVETTEAVTVPEETEEPETTAAPETEAPETVPETTAAEQTDPAETVPVETEPQETAAPETVPEEPAETLPEETVAEETVAEVTEEAAGANDTIVYPGKITVTAARTETYLGRDVKLTASFAPSTTTEIEVEWDVLMYTGTDDNGERQYDPAPADCVIFESTAGDTYLRVTETSGVYTVWARQSHEAADGTVVTVESEPVDVTFYNYEMEINRAAVADENWPDDGTGKPDKSDFAILQTGESMDISVAYWRWIGDEEPSIQLPVHTAAVMWTVEMWDPATEEATTEDASKYVSWSVREDTKELTLTAKLVTEYQFVRVRAKEVGENNTLIGDSSIIVRLYPDSYKLHITEIVDEYGMPVSVDVTNGELVVDITEFEAPYLESGEPVPEIRITLEAGIWPIEGDEALKWSTSDTLADLDDPDEKDDWNHEMDLILDRRSGETTVTVQGVEHPGISATVTIRRERLIQQILPDTASEKLQNDELMVGKSFHLQAVAYADREYVDDSLLVWELAEGDEAYATLTDQGVLTAKNVTEGKVITVRCSVLDNEEDANFELYIPIRPKATAVNIYSDTFLSLNAPAALADVPHEVPYGQIINGQTITVDARYYEAKVPAFQVETYVGEYYGAGDKVGAKQEATWTSSNTSVAYFDKQTDALIWKGNNGTTKITATAKDGSGKSASVTLRFGVKLEGLQIEGTEDMFLRSGSSWTFGLTYMPENAMNKEVDWLVYELLDGELVDATNVATITSKGKLTAKTVYDNHKVIVFAVAKDDPDVYDYFEVLIRPMQDGALTILQDGSKCVTKTTISLDVGGPDLYLDAFFVPSEYKNKDEYDWAGASWRSSNPKVAYVEDGVVTPLKVGTATITATSQDKKTATVTIKVVSQVDDIEIVEKKYPENYEGVLAVGKSLDMKATVTDNDTPNGKPTISKVTWHIAPGGEAFATVSSSGKVTARKDADVTKLPAYIEVYAKATDGSEMKSNYYTIWIYPAPEAMRIDIDQAAATTGSYTHYLSYSGESVGNLTANVFPSTASDMVTWKSSNPKIAEVDEDGAVTAYKAGTVTITATTMDGANMKATFKLKIVNKISWVEWNNDANELISDTEFAIGGGKTLNLKPVFYGPDGKKMSVAVEWDDGILDEDYGTAFDRFNKGSIVAARVTQPKFVTVTIRVDAKYASDFAGFEIDEETGKASLSVTVGVYPVTTSLEIVELTASGYRSTNEIWLRAGASVELGVLTDPTNAAQGWTWKSSNEKIAKVTADGQVIPQRDSKTGEYKAGTITITATAKDGSGKKDTIKIVFAK